LPRKETHTFWLKELLYIVTVYMMRRSFQKIKLDDKNRMTKESCTDYEATSTIGMYGKTKDKVIYETDRKVYYKAHMISVKEGVKYLESKTHFSVQPNPQGVTMKHVKEMAVHNVQKDEYYCKSKGSFKLEDIDNKFDYKIYEYKDDERPAKEIFDERVKAFEEIGNMMNVDVKKLLYCDILVSRQIAYDHLKYLHGCEFIDAEEGVILDASTRGPLNYAMKGLITNVWDYDFNSMYIHIMSQSDFRFPMTKPKKVNKIKSGYLHICKCEVKGLHKWFVRTPDDYYNTYQLDLMDLLKIPYVVNRNEIYCYDYVESKDIFDYMVPMYQLKAKGNKYTKQVLNDTWGSLGKKGQFTVPFDQLLDEAIKNVVHIDPVKNIVTIEDKERPYRHASGRIKSFLMAYARLMLVETMLKVENAGYEIYQANTDGFISNIPPEQMTEIKTISSLMGDIKIEKVYKGTYDVKHVRRVDKVEF
jgi:hypothetical protein